MKISIGHLRQIIKEEIENQNTVNEEDALDAKLANAIRSSIVGESYYFNHRNLHEGSAEIIAAAVAAIPLGISAVKWGPSSLLALQDKVSDWLDEIYQKTQVMATNRAIKNLFKDLMNDEYLAKVLNEYRAGKKGYTFDEVIEQIEEIMQKHKNALLSSRSVYDSLEKGEIPRINDDTFTFMR